MTSPAYRLLFCDLRSDQLLDALPVQGVSLDDYGRETSSTETTTAWTGATRLMNPVLYAAFEMFTPTGVTAGVSFDDGLGEIDSWVANASNGWTFHEITKPVRQNFMNHCNYRLKHSVRSGTGSIRTNCLGVYTRNSFSASEAPQ